MIDRNSTPTLETLRARKRMNDAIRSFFDEKGFLEVETPIAVRSPGLEPHLFAFETLEHGPDGSKETLYLHTSPEYAMKRLLARNSGHIYQIARVFRNGERSSTHTPEFTMLEWYRSPGRFEEIMQDAEDVVDAVAEAVGGPFRPKGHVRMSISEAFVAAGLSDPLEIDDLAELTEGLRIRPDPLNSWDDIFFHAFFKYVEPTFEPERTTLLYGYPARMAALARIDPARPRAAQRFELYLGPMELANAFYELNDPVEQRARFLEDLAVRRDKKAPEYPIDEGLLSELDRMGDAAGIALGLDRLLMSCLRLPSIQDTVCFPPRSSV